MTSRNYFSGICYVHGPDVGLICMLVFGAIIELACGWSLDRFDGFMGIIAWHAAIVFLTLAMFSVWGIVRFEQRYNLVRS